MSEAPSDSVASSSRVHLSVPPPPKPTSKDDTDALFEALEEEIDDDFDIGGFREKRLEQLKAQVEKASKMRDSNYGKLTEIKIEKDVIAATANAKRSVLHLFHRDFRRCRIMDRHLEKLAAKHFDTLFIRAEVSNVPFLVTKLEVKVLPCVIGFVGGISKMKLVGFEELEGGDDFNTSSLEIMMYQCEVLNRNPGSDPMSILAGTGGGSSKRTGAKKAGKRSGIRGGRGSDESDTDDD